MRASFMTLYAAGMDAHRDTGAPGVVRLIWKLAGSSHCAISIHGNRAMRTSRSVVRPRARLGLGAHPCAGGVKGHKQSLHLHVLA
eukprot:1179073-Prorocentrum_minimum.AAC.3